MRALDLDLAVAARGRAVFRDTLADWQDSAPEDPVLARLDTIALLLGGR